MNAALRGSDGCVLLVGDGDFSFSLALSKYLSPSCILGTNLEDEESIQKHKNAKENMQELLEKAKSQKLHEMHPKRRYILFHHSLQRNKGANLILGVDARELHTHPQIRQQRFQRIIFNFPHIGGKSNNKKNRALLNDFFKSASYVLVPEAGEVMVTLCRGQGGTPVDQPRLWADTWQIVSMAANSGFILTGVIPFKTEIYPSYSCTGFRSQDKGFRTEGGLTHTFKKRDPICVPQDVNPLPISLDKKEILCPTYLHSKILSYRKILENPFHPLKQSQDALISEMQKLKLAKIIHEDQLPCLIQRLDLAISSPELWACPLRLCKSFAEEEKEERISLFNQGAYTTFSSSGLTSSADVLKMSDAQRFLKDDKDLYFRTSLIENIPFLLDCDNFEENQWITTYGLTFKHGIISPDFLPMNIELLAFTKFHFGEDNRISENIHTIICDILKTCFSISPNFDLITEDQLPIQIKAISIEFLKNIKCKTIPKEMCIGHIIKVSNESNDSRKQFLGFLLNINELTEIYFQLDHKNILWHENTRNFLKPDPQLQSGSVMKHEPISIFPLKFTHDMSFWENTELPFDENQLSQIVRDVAGDCVSNVTLIDIYQDPETERTGRCYRFTFQSWDFCLSYKTSWEMQSLIRLVTAKKLGVTLR